LHYDYANLQYFATGQVLGACPIMGIFAQTRKNIDRGVCQGFSSLPLESMIDHFQATARSFRGFGQKPPERN
jgi:hypothetical protein